MLVERSVVHATVRTLAKLFVGRYFCVCVCVCVSVFDCVFVCGRGYGTVGSGTNGNVRDDDDGGDDGRAPDGGGGRGRKRGAAVLECWKCWD